MGGADTLVALVIRVALEIVVRRLHRVCTVKHHHLFVAGVVHQPREHIRLLHLL